MVRIRKKTSKSGGLRIKPNNHGVMKSPRNQHEKSSIFKVNLLLNCIFVFYYPILSNYYELEMLSCLTEESSLS